MSASNRNDDLLIRVSRRAMACEFEVCFPAEPYPHGTELALETLDLVDALEGQLSYFRPTSEITRINLLAADGPVEVEPGLFELLRLAARLHEETGGAYDITSTPLWEAWGFARRAGGVPSELQVAEARQLVGGRLMELDAAGRTIRFLKPGVRINLGSVAKGYALDRCGEKLLSSGMADFLLHGGQSSVLGRGKQIPAREDSRETPWEVGVRHPGHPERRLGTIRLCNRALGTSGSQFQSFRHEGRRYGHILDPRTGQPAEGVLSATVVAPTAALADALSTALFVMGARQSLDYCRAHPEIGAVLVCPNPHGGGIEVHTVGLSDEVLTLSPSAA